MKYIAIWVAPVHAQYIQPPYDGQVPIDPEDLPFRHCARSFLIHAATATRTLQTVQQIWYPDLALDRIASVCWTYHKGVQDSGSIFYWMCLKMNGTPAPPIFCMFVTGKNDDKPWEIYGNIRHAAMGPWDLAQIPGLQKILRFVSPLQSPFALLCPRRATMALHRPCPAFGS